jgi:hypothetical protein
MALRLRFDSDEDVAEGEEMGMEVEETLEAEGEEAAAVEEVIGRDRTSADYYFNSYSHFGTSRLIFQRRSIFVSPLQSCVHPKNRILHVLWSRKNARLSVLL